MTDPVTPEHMTTILAAYDAKLSNVEPYSRQHGNNDRVWVLFQTEPNTEKNQRGILAQCRWMIHRLQAGEPDLETKRQRWFGFIQGLLWVAGKYSIDEMRDHNAGREEP